MKNFNFFLSAAVSLIVAAACGIQLWFEYGTYALLGIAAMLFALPVNSVLHELGHILFGALSKIKAKPHFSLFSSSRCDLIPKTDQGLKGRVTATAVGGIVINVITAAVSLIAAFLPAMPTYISVLAPTALYLFIFNALPAELESGKTDGEVIAELAKNTAQGQVMLAVLTVQAKLLKGTPIEEIDRTLLFDLPVIREDDQSFISLLELRIEYCKATGDSAGEEEYTRRLKEITE